MDANARQAAAFRPGWAERRLTPRAFVDSPMWADLACLDHLIKHFNRIFPRGDQFRRGRVCKPACKKSLVLSIRPSATDTGRYSRSWQALEAGVQRWRSGLAIEARLASRNVWQPVRPGPATLLPLSQFSRLPRSAKLLAEECVPVSP